MDRQWMREETEASEAEAVIAARRVFSKAGGN
jgi:hypothetical protein